MIYLPSFNQTVLITNHDNELTDSSSSKSSSNSTSKICIIKKKRYHIRFRNVYNGYNSNQITSFETMRLEATSA